MPALGLDFGTSNSAAGVAVAGRPHVIPLEPGQPTLPTAVFFDAGARRTVFGHAAVAALIDGREGRFMRALKSVLGTPLMREKRLIVHERLTLIEVVARFLAEVRTRAGAATGQTYGTVLSGRPVRFHRDPARDRRAEADLRECYAMAGFDRVEFLYEPEAAALASGEIAPGEVGLIVDIGGGTSDFSVFRAGREGIEIVASHGVRIGGTDFDRAVSVAHVMPLLGMGTGLRAEIGPAVHEAPPGLFLDLATWEKIPFLYTGEVRRDVARMVRLATAPERMARLATVLEMEIGHDVAFAVERGKIAANRPAPGWGAIDLRLVEPGLSHRLTADELAAGLSGFATEIGAEAEETVARAGLEPGAVSKLVFVGGSSLLGAVEAELSRHFPGARHQRGDAFTAVVDGLALAAARLG